MIGGALRVVSCRNITIAHSTLTCYSNNTAAGWQSCTKEVLTVYSELLLIANCTFNNNKEGAIIVGTSNGKILSSYFSGNVAQRGAAIQAEFGNVVIVDTYFCYNEVDLDYYKLNVYTLAMPGGAVCCYTCKMEIVHSVFEHNKGVALLGFKGAQIKLKSCQFSHNTAAELGGGIYATMLTNIEISGKTLFENNVAKYGAAFHTFYSTISIVGKVSIINNTAYLGAIGIIHSTAVIKAYVIFSGNVGSFFVYSGEVSILSSYNTYKEAIFTQNYQLDRIEISKQNYERSEFIREGGAITLFVSRLELLVKTDMSHNTASNGGGIMAITSTIVCNSTLLVSNNYVTDTGAVSICIKVSYLYLVN